MGGKGKAREGRQSWKLWVDQGIKAGRNDKGNEMIRTNDKGGRDGEGKGMGKDEGGIMKMSSRCHD